jgi:hypothetical protein
MDYNPLDDHPKIQFDWVDWVILITCIVAVLYVTAQVVRAAIA